MDYLFYGFAIIFAIVAAIYTIAALLKRAARSFAGAVCWGVLATGLFLQALAPNLSIESSGGHSVFVIPASQAQTPVAPLVQKERNYKVLSAMFMFAGAVGFGLYYWPLLKQKS